MVWRRSRHHHTSKTIPSEWLWGVWYGWKCCRMGIGCLSSYCRWWSQWFQLLQGKYLPERGHRRRRKSRGYFSRPIAVWHPTQRKGATKTYSWTIRKSWHWRWRNFFTSKLYQKWQPKLQRWRLGLYPRLSFRKQPWIGSWKNSRRSSHHLYNVRCA